MKILQASFIRGISGSERFLLNVIPELIDRGYTLGMLVLYVDKKETEVFVDEVEKTGCKVHLVNINLFHILFSFKKIGNIMKSYDVTSSHLLFSDFVLSVSKFLFASQVTLTSGKHGYQEWYNNKYGFDPKKKTRNLYWAVARLAELNIDRSFAISNGLYSLYSGIDIVKKNNLRLIYYGFNFKNNVKLNPDCRYSDIQLCVVGRLTAFKGHRYALKALKILVIKFPKIKLVIVGCGELEENLKTEVNSLGLERNVIFTGFQPNSREYMYNSDIILIPSVSEGFGIVIAEGMSVKKPIVAFNVPSPNELLTHNESGILVDPYNIDSYALGIADLIENKAKRETIAKNAYQKLIEDYSITKMIDKLENFYKES